MKVERPENRQPIPPHAKKAFEGKLFDVYQWNQELFDGSTTVFEKIKRDDTVVIVPSTEDKKLIFLEDEQPGRDPILTFPCGRIDIEGDDPFLTAKRELLEETGYASEEWSLWKAFQPVTKLDWAVYVFVAKKCRKVQEADPGVGEKITTNLVTLDDVIALIGDPRFVSDSLDIDLLKAKYDPEERKKLEETIF